MVIFYKNQNIKCWLQKTPKKTKSFAIFEKHFAIKSLFFLVGLVFIEIELLGELGLVKLIYFRKFVHILVITIFFNCLLPLDEHKMECFWGFIKFWCQRPFLSPISPPRWHIHTLRALV